MSLQDYMKRLNTTRAIKDRSPKINVSVPLRRKEMLIFHFQQSHVIGIGRVQRRDKNRSSLSYSMYVDDPLSRNKVEDC